MKKKILLALVTVVLLSSIIFTGCGGGVSQSEYDSLTALLSNAEANLSVAQDNLEALQSEKSAVDSDLATAQAQVTDLQAQVADLQQQLADYVDRYDFTGLTTAEIAEKIVANYRATHLYEQDIYDCNNMASDVWNMLKAQGIDAVIVVGNIDIQITSILNSEHAWVLVEVAPDEYLALDPTIGYAISHAPGSLYYQGWSFINPALLKANDDLRTEYNTRVAFVNVLVSEINDAMDLYNNSTTQAEADKWLALYNKLQELKTDQEALLTTLENQFNQLATQFNYN
jgi:hypothetical protein